MYCDDPMNKMIVRQVMCPFMPKRPMYGLLGGHVMNYNIAKIQEEAIKRQCSIRCPGCERDCIIFKSMDAPMHRFSQKQPEKLNVTPDEFMALYPVTLTTFDRYTSKLDREYYQPAWFAELMRTLCVAAEKVRTGCCDIKMCYKCRMRMDRGNHVCVIDKVSGDVRACPKCRVPFIKTEGCNSIRCPCGHSYQYRDSISTVR